MYASADQLPNGTTIKGYDICIVGGGVAGIAIARRLIASPLKVLVLCNGQPTDSGQDADPTHQSIYNGTLGPFLTKVDPIFTTRSRLNMYGGTSNHFWFYAHPMDEWDLKPRPGYRDAHWPIEYSELLRYYPDANATGDYGPVNYGDIAFWAKMLRGEPFPIRPQDKIVPAIWHAQEDPSLYQFQRHFGAKLQAAQNVTVLFNANVLNIAATADKTEVTELACSTNNNGKPGISFNVEAGQYVLALGGIEPVRLLKLSGLGDNAKGHLGRGFMMHPLILGAAKATFPTPVDPAIQNFYTSQKVTLVPPKEPGGQHQRFFRMLTDPKEAVGKLNFNAWGVVTPSAEALAEYKIGSFHSNFFFQDDGSINISINWESVPNEDSTITLDETQTDPVFGQPVVKVDWNLLEQEKRTVITGLELIKKFLLARGASGFQVLTDLSGGPEQWVFSPDASNPAGLWEGDHHMGALRMSKCPEDGIVDTNLKLHTMRNLYVAGSGVYPTTGHANPTLTIVALALRLADHLSGNCPSA